MSTFGLSLNGLQGIHPKRSSDCSDPGDAAGMELDMVGGMDNGQSQWASDTPEWRKPGGAFTSDMMALDIGSDTDG